jgi:hypothetical protein
MPEANVKIRATMRVLNSWYFIYRVFKERA